MSACINNRRRTVSINSPVIPTDIGGEGSDAEDDLDATDVVFNANLVTSTTSSIKDWRPMSSVSQPGKSKHDQDLLEEDKELEDDGESAKQHNSPPSRHRGSFGSSQPSRRSTRADVSPQRTLRHPCSYKTGFSSKGAHKSFITMDQRKQITLDIIKDNTRNRTNANGDRICRPYSTYSVSKSCERLAISPYGGPIMPGAAGRYREHYQSRNPPKLSKETLDALNSKFQKFYINLDLVAITENKKPIGALKRPPAPKTAKINDREQNSLHHGASERMNAVETTLGWQNRANEGKRFGVGYHVAMELSHNLETYRKARSASVDPEVPPHYITPKSDTSRLVNQPPEHLTQGEISIRKSLKSNAYDPEIPKREPTKFVKKKRPPSPPLSKMSRDKFLPEALRRRAEMENKRLFSGHSGLRLGKTTGDNVARADSATGNTNHRGLQKSNSDDAPNFVGSEGTESPTIDVSDGKLIIRGQSAKHTPRGESGRNGLTTPTPSPEPMMSSRTIEQRSLPKNQDMSDNSQNDAEHEKDTEQLDVEDGAQTDVALNDGDNEGSSVDPTEHTSNFDQETMNDPAQSVTSSMTSFRSVDITLPAEDDTAPDADHADGGANC